MSAIRRRDTTPERAVRSLLHGAGLRYRVDYPLVVDGIRIRPDVAFTALRLAVFVDGCFWHGCPEHGREPTKNTSYWGPKLAANIARGARHTELLESAGWTVLRFWEHEEPEAVAARVATEVARLRAMRSARAAGTLALA
jgi:DNA mismatch endonuclease (patch repair protein)